MTVEQVRAACPAPVWLARPTDTQPSAVNLTALTIDSRAIEPGQVFLALKGDRFDGHDFLTQAAGAGAALLIIDRDLPAARLAELSAAAENSGRKGGLWVLRVQDTRKALGRIAAAWRTLLGAGGAKVIAVCGSNGKTTTVRLIDAVLGATLSGVASEKSFNNDIGVPLTLLRARPGHQYIICEVGTNHPGEIAALGSLCSPDIAVITSIGREHLEFLGDLAGVAREEAAILTALRPGGVGIVTADSPHLRDLLKPAPSAITFGQAPDADLRLTDFSHTLIADQPAIRLSHNGHPQAFIVPLVGRHNASNALAAIAVGRRFGLSDKVIAEGLLCCRPPEMRWQAHDLGGGLWVVNDAYNANPDSVLASLGTFAEVFPAVMPATGSNAGGTRRRVAVLADMFELGSAAAAGHRDVGLTAASVLTAAGDHLVFVGDQSGTGAQAAVAAGHGRVRHVPRWDAPAAETLADELLHLASSGPTVVLLKGSRRMGLEKLLNILTARRARVSAGGPVPSTRTPEALRVHPV